MRNKSLTTSIRNGRRDFCFFNNVLVKLRLPLGIPKEENRELVIFWIL